MLGEEARLLISDCFLVVSLRLCFLQEEIATRGADRGEQVAREANRGCAVDVCQNDKKEKTFER